MIIPYTYTGTQATPIYTYTTPMYTYTRTGAKSRLQDLVRHQRAVGGGGADVEGDACGGLVHLGGGHGGHQTVCVCVGGGGVCDVYIGGGVRCV